MNNNHFFSPRPDGVIRIIPLMGTSSGLEPTFGTYYKRLPESLLNQINVQIIEKFLRKKKLEKIKNIMKEEYITKMDKYYEFYIKYAQEPKTTSLRKSDEEILEEIDISVIEQFLRKKKMQRIEKIKS